MKIVKESKFISHTKNSFLLNCDGEIIKFNNEELNCKKNNTVGGMWTKLKAVIIQLKMELQL